ncbi:MAG TPA: TolC family protein, partial [Saprospiraceae bacterium]|nr:TolC family protein [Saprospiraceae bacterium]
QSIDIDKLFSAGSLFGAIAGSLTQPIFNGRQIRTQYEVSIARQEEALIKYKMSVLNASREVSDALYTYKAADEKVKIKQKEFQAYVRAISDSEELMNYGMATYLEVLTARENMFNAQLSIINIEFSRLSAMVELYRAVGGGWR